MESNFETRGILPSSISKINDLQQLPYPYNRAAEIKAWVEQRPDIGAYVIIDDDHSINSLPTAIKAHCVLTSPMIGLDDERADLALEILYR